MCTNEISVPWLVKKSTACPVKLALRETGVSADHNGLCRASWASFLHAVMFLLSMEMSCLCPECM